MEGLHGELMALAAQAHTAVTAVQQAPAHIRPQAAAAVTAAGPQAAAAAAASALPPQPAPSARDEDMPAARRRPSSYPRRRTGPHLASRPCPPASPSSLARACASARRRARSRTLYAAPAVVLRSPRAPAQAPKLRRPLLWLALVFQI